MKNVFLQVFTAVIIMFLIWNVFKFAESNEKRMNTEKEQRLQKIEQGIEKCNCSLIN